ncbi:hypothetical protein Goshw_030036, partial [Gossypium schwendimanii]|nr:hypothetical protein [Gossypium schwendimanii]
QEAQVSKEVAADLSKPLSASHVSLLRDGGSDPLTGIKLPREVIKGLNVKVTRVQKEMAAELIASEIDGKSTMDLLRKKGE